MIKYTEDAKASEQFKRNYRDALVGHLKEEI